MSESEASAESQSQQGVAASDSRHVRIDRIELENFKSYKGFHTIGPFKDFTAIIGPNGSGKSNIMDAVCFVLGMRTWHLRGADLKDLIYRGDSSSARAFVKLILSSGTDEVIEFKRTIIATGQSEYRIDGAVVSADDYQAKLKSFNILIKARNCMIFQGDVEMVAARSGRELTALFEQISGSDEFQKEYDRLLEQKNQTEDNIRFNFKKIKGIDAEKKQYKEQKAEADTFNHLQDQLRSMNITSILFQLFYLKQDLDKLAADRDKKRKELDKVERAEQESESVMDTKRRELAELQLEYQSKQRDIRSIERALEENRPRAIAASESVLHLARRLDDNNRKLERIRHDIASRDTQVAGLEKDLAELDKQERQLEAEFVAQQASFKELSPSQWSELADIRERASVKSARDRQELVKLERAQKTEQDLLIQANQRIEELNRRLAEVRSEREALLARKSRAEVAHGEMSTQIASCDAEIDTLRRLNADSKTQYEEISQQLSNVQEQLRDAKSAGKESDREKRVKECVESLQRLFGPAVHGRVFDVVQPSHSDIARAVAIVLGSHMDSIIVDDEKTAQDCMQYMRDQRLGTATFLPLATVTGKSVDDSLRTLHRQVRPVIDILQYDRKYHRVVEYVCGRTLLCPDIDLARKFAFGQRERYKVVTNSGTLISKSGFITGGASEQGLERSRRRWDEKAITTLKTRRDKLLSDLNGLGATIRGFSKEQQLLTDRHGLSDRLVRVKTEIQLIDTRLASITAEIQTLESQLDEQERIRTSANTNVSSRTATISELKTRISDAEKQLYAAFERKHGLTNIRDFEDRQLTFQRLYNEKRLQLKTQHSRVKGLLMFEKARLLETQESELQASIVDDEQSRSSFVTQAQQLEATVTELSDRLKSLLSESQSLSNKILEMENSLKAFKKAQESRHRVLVALRKQLAASDASTDSLLEKRRNFYRQCVVEQVDLPLAEDSRPLPSADELETPTPSDPEAVPSQVANDDDVSVNFEKLPAKWKGATSTAHREELAQRIVEDTQIIQAELDKLAPNLKAGDRLQDVKTRLKSTHKDLESAKESTRRIQDEFRQVMEQRRSAFMDAFNVTSRAINSIYKQITGGAGMASLSLDSEEEPYLHNIRYDAVPPRKSFRGIEQLSGGEKTVAALALLLAIHSYRPAPFFIMDEIDAALDVANVVTVARYLKERSSDVQIIIISLKPQCYDKADSLIGVCVDVDEDTSQSLTLDLTSYD